MPSLDDVTQFVGNLVGTLFGARSEKILKRLAPRVTQINAFEPEIMRLTDRELKAKTEEFRKRIEQLRARDPRADENGKVNRFLLEIQPEAFALAREAGRRTLGMRHFDVQLMGGMVLHQGMIAEMVTGEGKTLVATLSSYLNALPRRPHEYAYVHVVTVNDYLAKRDAEWNRPLFELLGMTCGAIQSQMDSWERHPVYACDIVYGTNSEFGFDYLRDNMKMDPEKQVQKVRHYAIVDEVDSILIDEARTPLIISGSPDESVIEKYELAGKLSAHLQRVPEEEQDRVEKLRLQQQFEEPEVGHYIVDEKDHTVALTQRGIKECEKYLGIENFYAGAHMDWPHFIDNALKAKELYKRGTQYEVTQGREGKLEVIITDEFTGRLMYGRRWSDGLHQAVEAKELLGGETIQMEAETQTLATITIQNFFKLYKKLAGMTGTALTEAREFGKIYKLEVVSLPTNRPLRRFNSPDVIYGSEKEKWEAICEEIEAFHGQGRPILVGTTSVEKSEKLAGLLERRGLKGRFEVLNAKQHQREAFIVAKAGELGSITVATNMAGRGTDIVLGRFSLAQLVEHWQTAKLDGKPLAPRDFELDRTPGQMEQHLIGYWAKMFLPAELFEKTPVEQRRAALERYWAQTGFPALVLGESVRELGGLHIVGTERHEARRIDNQLRGRAGRQGDPGSSRFFLSLDDDLMRIFAKDWVRKFLRSTGLKDGVPLESRMVSRSIEKAQRRVEEHHFGVRRRLLEYDEVMNEQRKLVYSLRQKILEWQELKETMTGWIEDAIALAVEKEAAGEDPPNAEAIHRLINWARRKFLVELTPADMEGHSCAEIEGHIRGRVMAFYEQREKDFGEANVPQSRLLSYSPEELALPPEEKVEMVRRKLAAESGLPLEAIHAEEALEGDLVIPIQESGKPVVGLVIGKPSVLAGKLPTFVTRPAQVQKMRLLERFLMLDMIDTKWKDHLHNMDVLREGIYLRSYAQKDPKIEYKREGFDLFMEMFSSMKEQATDMILKVQPTEEVEQQKVESVWNEDQAQTIKEEAKSAFAATPEPAGGGGGTAEMAAQSEHGGEQIKAVATIRRTGKKVGPNDPCPCGSGKKYKKCCGRFGGGDASRGPADHKGRVELGG